MTNQILIVEDDPDISDLLRINLEYAGFKTLLAANGRDVKKLLAGKKCSLVLLDVMLPDQSGLSLLPSLQKRGIPVIIVSAKDRIPDKIKGLELGADDYVTKPFDNIELLARVRAVLRRTRAADPVIKIGRVVIDTVKEKVTSGGEVINLTSTEYRILSCLAENAGVIFSRDRLLERVWGYDAACETRAVDMHIKRLRAKLKADVIQTVHGRGYKIEA